MNYIFTFSNMTAAQTAKASLNSAGIPVSVRRTSGTLAENGCGYMIEVPYGNGLWASTVLRKNGAMYRKCYRKDSGGQFREVRL